MTGLTIVRGGHGKQHAAAVAGFYGQLIQTDGLNNQQIGAPSGYKLSIKHRCKKAGTLDYVDVYKKADGTAGSSGYYNGTGGSILLRVETDDGTGKPSGTLVSAGATVTVTTAGGTSSVTRFTLGTSVTTTVGQLLHFVFTNADGSPTANFVSINCVDTHEQSPNPLQPGYSDADQACLQSTGGAYAIDRTRYPIIAIHWTDGTIWGQSIFDAKSGSGQTNIGGNNKVRLNFTPAADVTGVISAHFRVMKPNVSTAAALVQNVRDLTGGGTLLETASIAAASVALTSDLPNGYGSRYVDLTFAGPRTFTAGRNYAYELTSTEATNKYIAFPAQRGGAAGFAVNLAGLDRFMDGYWEQTSDGSTWTLFSSSTEFQPQAYFSTLN